jgi:hypothetical protein
MKALYIYLGFVLFLTYIIWFRYRKKRPQLRKVVSRKFPKNGDFIRLTWLPDPKNGWPGEPTPKNCYIGSEGIVEDMKEDGSFTLRMEGAILIVHNKYEWVLVEYWYRDATGKEHPLPQQYEWKHRLLVPEVRNFYGDRFFTKIKQ